MTVQVMRVNSVEKHPNADSLFVHQMTDRNGNDYTIVANSTNLYSVGDNAIVAKIGTRLKTGEYIDKANVRGVVSLGMALGKTDAEIGTDLTKEYCPEVSHVNWPEITSLFNVRKYLKEIGESRSIRYRSKIKLDGTNAAVQIFPDGTLVCQSREEIITPEKDNAGFARWVSENKDYFLSIKTEEPIIVFGEWCGQGIQKRCSISQIDKKIFAVFAIQYDQEFDINPETIRKVLPEHNQVYVLWFNDEIVLNYENQELLSAQAEEINKLIFQIEDCDPWVKSVFGIEGLGEGLVYYPISECRIVDEKILVDRSFYKDYVFKAKGEKHAVVKTKAPVQIDPEVAKNIDEFVEMFVTENRLEQFSTKVGGFDVKKTGLFLKAFNDDVIKESTAELEASGLTWKDVSSAVSTKARNWYIEQTKKL